MGRIGGGLDYENIQTYVCVPAVNLDRPGRVAPFPPL